MKIVRRGALPVGGDSGLDDVRPRRPGRFRPGRGGGARSRRSTSGRGSSTRCCRSSTSTRSRRCAIVVDAANGMAGAMLPPVLERLPQVDVVRCYFDPDGTFPNHEPNPLLEENRAFIVAKTREESADLGVAYDGDADRCFFVDDTGEFVPGDFVTALSRRGDAGQEPGRHGALRPARELGGAAHDRARPAARRSSTASATRSSSTGCGRRTRSSPARSRRTTTSATSRRPTPASSRSCSCSS